MDIMVAYINHFNPSGQKTGKELEVSELFSLFLVSFLTLLFSPTFSFWEDRVSSTRARERERASEYSSVFLTWFDRYAWIWFQKWTAQRISFSASFWNVLLCGRRSRSVDLLGRKGSKILPALLLLLFFFCPGFRAALSEKRGKCSKTFSSSLLHIIWREKYYPTDGRASIVEYENHRDKGNKRKPWEVQKQQQQQDWESTSARWE